MEELNNKIENISTELYTLYHYLRFTCGLDEEYIHVLRVAGQLIYQHSEIIAENIPDGATLDNMVWIN